MREEEIIKNIKEMIQWSDHNTYKKALQGLLDLYNKEKEKNEELEVKCKMQEYRISVIDERELVSKDKIKKIIYPTPTNPIPIEIQTSKLYKKIINLLEEDNK